MDLIQQLRANGGKTVRPQGTKVPPPDSKYAQPQINGLSLPIKIAHYTSAKAKHIWAGQPQRSDERVNEIFAICGTNQCGFFAAVSSDVGECRHPSCGCYLKRVGVKGKNKLRMATEKCPVGMWE